MVRTLAAQSFRPNQGSTLAGTRVETDWHNLALRAES